TSVTRSSRCAASHSSGAVRARSDIAALRDVGDAVDLDQDPGQLAADRRPGRTGPVAEELLVGGGELVEVVDRGQIAAAAHDAPGVASPGLTRREHVPRRWALRLADGPAGNRSVPGSSGPCPET